MLYVFASVDGVCRIVKVILIAGALAHSELHPPEHDFMSPNEGVNFMTTSSTIGVR